MVWIRSAGETALLETEPRQVEEALLDCEQRFRSLFQYLSDAIFLTLADGKLHAANPAACALFGMSEQGICQAGREGLVGPKDPRLAAALEQRRWSGQYSNVELRHIRERLRLMGGSVVTQTTPGRGTRAAPLAPLTLQTLSAGERPLLFEGLGLGFEGRRGPVHPHNRPSSARQFSSGVICRQGLA